MTHIERHFSIIKDVPQKLFEDAEKWLKYAKTQLDRFMESSQNPNFIAFDMLESKSNDVIQQGEMILL